jgi:hypothetical protein
MTEMFVLSFIVRSGLPDPNNTYIEECKSPLQKGKQERKFSWNMPASPLTCVVQFFITCNEASDLIRARVYVLPSILFFTILHWRPFAARQLVLVVSVHFGELKRGRF